MKDYCLLAVITLCLLTSCSTTQPLFDTDLSESDNLRILHQYFSQNEPVLKPGDKLTLSIWGHDELSVGSVNSKFSSNEATGRWITLDLQGEVNLPKIGRTKLSGFNVKEANYILEQAYRKHLKDPIINVKVLNHYVTVMGEVGKPGNYDLDNEKVSLVQMLGRAEGLAEYANNEQVKVIRNVDGRSIELLVDMTNIMSTMEYNVVLQPNDIIYVEPTVKKAKNRNLEKATPIASIITAVTVIVSVLFK